MNLLSNVVFFLPFFIPLWFFIIGTFGRPLNPHQRVYVGSSARERNKVHSFHGHQVIRFIFRNTEERQVFEKIVTGEEYDELDVWNEAVGDYVDIRIPPSNKEKVFKAMGDLKHQVLIDDVQELIDQEKQSSKRHKAGSFANRKSKSSLDKQYIFGDYQDTETYVSFLSSLNDTSIVDVGKSYLNESIKGIKFGRGKDQHIVIHGGIHAREWISPAVTTYIAYSLLQGDRNASRLLEKFTFTVIPVLNVDGYAYSRKVNRMWRKNRQPNIGSSCVGTDPNRNFDAQWNGPGSSSSPCSEAYRGSKPFSAPETKAIADYISGLGNVVSYIDFHAYSQLWMFPWGYTCKDKIPDYSLLNEASIKSVQSLSSVHKTKYRYGDICRIIYAASGSSIDWTYDVAKVKFSFGVELRDQGKHGFMLPANQIIPTGEETFAGVVALWNFMAEYLEKK